MLDLFQIRNLTKQTIASVYSIEKAGSLNAAGVSATTGFMLAFGPARQFAQSGSRQV